MNKTAKIYIAGHRGPIVLAVSCWLVWRNWPAMNSGAAT